jgi:hypothetical protein
MTTIGRNLPEKLPPGTKRTSHFAAAAARESENRCQPIRKRSERSKTGRCFFTSQGLEGTFSKVFTPPQITTLSMP